MTRAIIRDLASGQAERKDYIIWPDPEGEGWSWKVIDPADGRIIIEGEGEPSPIAAGSKARGFL